MLGKVTFQKLLAQQPRMMKQPHQLTLQNPLFATRQSHWMAYLQQRVDRKTGEKKYVEWSEIIRGVEEPMKNGKHEVDRHLGQKRHIKRNVLKQDKKDKVIYNRKVKKVEDLLKYIQFMKDRPDDFPAK